MDWKIEWEEGFESRFRRFSKKYPHEANAMSQNLENYFEQLNDGTHPLQIKEGYIHHKVGLGIKEIDQKGCIIPKPMQSRLYVYPDVDTRTLHVITVGNKSDQTDDVRFARKYVTDLRKT